jgi:hypothetical protein
VYYIPELACATPETLPEVRNLQEVTTHISQVSSFILVRISYNTPEYHPVSGGYGGIEESENNANGYVI